MKPDHQCWDFVMSSLVRIYGVDKVKSEERFHAFALEWCDENNYTCNILTSLTDVDIYFQNTFEGWIE